MDVFVAGRQNAKIRREGFKDRLVEVTPAEPVLAFAVREAAEVHNEDGTVSRAFAGDFIVEWPDGTVRAVERARFLELFLDPEAVEDVDEPQAPEADPTLPDVISRPRDLEPPPFEDEATTAEGGQEDEGERDEVADYVAKMEAQVREWATAAEKQGLIDAGEKAEWEQTGELPEGVEVLADGDGNWIVSRKGASDAATGEPEQGDESARDELQGK